MQEKEREWRASVEASIESKDARSRQLQQEREAAKKQVRAGHAHSLSFVYLHGNLQQQNIVLL